MGWELRRGKRVYYRKVREGGRVRSVYCGAGERGERAAREDEERRARATAVASAVAEPEAVVPPPAAPSPIRRALLEPPPSRLTAPPEPRRIDPFGQVYRPPERHRRGRERLHNHLYHLLREAEEEYFGW